jgi:hypothetical protein
MANRNREKYMGDKSKKAAHKKDVQKLTKDHALVREKQENTEIQHHPSSVPAPSHSIQHQTN